MKKKTTGYLKRATLVLGIAALLMPTTALAEGSGTSGLPAAQQQTITVKGHIVDETGEPLIGVTVKIDNATGGTVSDIDGNFSLTVPSGKTNLVFSYTGYKTMTMQASSNMTVRMEPDALGLDEVVVIGFGTVRKRDVTGAVAQVKSDVILQTPTSDVAT